MPCEIIEIKDDAENNRKLDELLVLVYPTRWNLPSQKDDYLTQLQSIEHNAEPVHCLHFTARKSDVNMFSAVETTRAVIFREGGYQEFDSHEYTEEGKIDIATGTPSHLVTYARSVLGRGANLPEYSIATVDVATHPPTIAAGILGPLSTDPDQDRAKARIKKALMDARTTISVQTCGRIARLRPDEEQGCFPARRALVLHNWTTKPLRGEDSTYGIPTNELNDIVGKLRDLATKVHWAAVETPQDAVLTLKEYFEQFKIPKQFVRRARYKKIVAKLKAMRKRGDTWGTARRAVRRDLNDFTTAEIECMKQWYKKM